MNYNEAMENELEQIKLQNKKPTLLLHVCCAPCSSAVLERIAPYFKIILYYYNPNITEAKEYQKRVIELKTFIEKIAKDNIEIIEGNYEPKVFQNRIKGLEQEKEGGKRCYECYHLRLEESAKKAKELNCDYFTTTLSISPYKNANWLNEIGKDLETIYQIKYLYSDFKKKNGYQRSIILSKQYHLYRQDYCGCTYSKQERQFKIKQ